jgi:hypothetical protein
MAIISPSQNPSIQRWRGEGLKNTCEPEPHGQAVKQLKGSWRERECGSDQSDV